MILRNRQWHDLGGEHVHMNPPLLLCEPRVDADRREVARNEKLVQFDRPRDGLDEDDNLGKNASASAAYLATRGTYLVELEGIKELV